MREEYADKYAGFVIEYDLSMVAEQADTAKVLSHTYPVTYYKRLLKVPLLPFIERAFYRDLYGKDTDIFDATKSYLSNCWQRRMNTTAKRNGEYCHPSSALSFP